MKKAITLALLLAGCAAAPSEEDLTARTLKVMQASFKEHGQAKLDRLDQDETQRACSTANPSRESAARVEKVNSAALRYPVDGKLTGDWREGEKIAQSGVGKQFSDDPKRPSGANCYACHQLSKQEISFGTIGPSLYNYGNTRGASEAVQRYTFAKLYNPHSFTACSTIPLFFHDTTTTEQQVKHLVGLLLDPASPVNQ